MPLHWKKPSVERKKLKMLENKGLAESTKAGRRAEGGSHRGAARICSPEVERRVERWTRIQHI